MEQIYFSFFISFFQIVTIVFGIIAFVFCIIMVFSVDNFKKLSFFFNKSFSLRRKTKFLDIQRHSVQELLILPNIKLFFIFTLICSSISLFYLVNYFDVISLAKSFSINASESEKVYEVVFSSTKIFLISSLFSVIVLSIIGIRKKEIILSLTQKCTRWFSTRQAYKAVDISQDIDESLLRYHTPLGVIGMIISIMMIVTCLLTLCKG
ncbi:MAG: hypothetical protein KAI43_01290 [Candidatus Aureabacteria bacterium]|nr:hypothetical protein [Candidatus Auribacterota bacterium]